KGIAPRPKLPARSLSSRDTERVSLNSTLGPVGFGGLVECVETVAEFFEDVPAADLQGRGHLSRVDLERAGEDQEGLDPLGLAAAPHALLDAALEQAAGRRAGDQVACRRWRRPGGAGVSGGFPEAGEVGDEERRDEGLAVAVDDGLVDAGVARQQAFE